MAHGWKPARACPLIEIECPQQGAKKEVNMAFSQKISRRTFLQSSSLAAVGVVTIPGGFPVISATPSLVERPLQEFGYGDVTLTSDLHEKQLHLRLMRY